MHDLPDIRPLRRADLTADGIGDAALRRLLRDDRLHRIRPGVYVRSDAWNSLSTEERMVLDARALAASSRTELVFSHLTAAALHGLPLWSARNAGIHVTLADARPRTGVGTVRHRGRLDASDIVEISGLRCTSLVRTVADVARTAPFESAVCVADAALRSVSGEHPRATDPRRAHELRAQALRIARGFAHGAGKAERVLGFADAGAQLPGESISRIRLRQLGFRRIRLQVPIAAPTGGSFYADFGLDDVPAWGEFDGIGKYGTLDTVRGVLDAEKRREDWIRGTTGRPLARWGFADLATPESLRARLAAFRIHPPR